ncbi:hypothetical protein F5051DRAFT_420628 [Lentinula edodes]|nr:hypothetical protein F5051DRAFT_420628 [Lentinula edodes]
MFASVEILSRFTFYSLFITFNLRLPTCTAIAITSLNTMSLCGLYYLPHIIVFSRIQKLYMYTPLLN